MIETLVFIYGLIFGSFYNVVALRSLENKKVNNFKYLLGNSHCPTCNKRLRAVNLIPIFSYLFQKGKCSNCKTKISWIYPVFELLTGLSFLLIYLIYGISLEFLIHIILVSSLIISSLTDLKEMIVLDRIVIPTFIGILILRIAIQDQILNYLISFIIFFIIFYILMRFELIGGGDVRFIAIIALALGNYNTVLVLMISSVLTILLYIMKLINRELRFVPFLLAGTLAFYLYKYLILEEILTIIL